jgi:predicted transcriptional regulator
MTADPAPGRPVDLRAVRVEAALARLAELGRRGVDVHAVLEAAAAAPDPLGPGGPMSAADHATSVRLSPATLARLDRAVEALQGTPAATVAGGRWGRSTALRLAVEAGLAALEAGRGAGLAAVADEPRVIEVDGSARGTRYLLTLWRDRRGVGVAWPDAGWSVGALGSRPAAGWLEEHGLNAADAHAVAELVGAAWHRVAG